MGKAPEPTPPKETSAASTATNVSTAIANSYLSNFNEYGPDGSRVFNKIGSERVYDPYTKQMHTIPRFQVKTKLSDSQQRIKDQQDSAKLRLSALASDQAGRLRNYLSDEPFEYNPRQHQNWALGLYDRNASDDNARAEEAMATRLSNQGIRVGSEAYRNAIKSMRQGQVEARNQFLLDSYETGFQSAQAQRNQPINEITALMSGSQVSAPTFSTTPNQVMMPTTDNAAIIGEYDSNRIAAAQANMNFAGGLFSSVLGVLSDERVKEDKQKVGETKDGIGLYTFRYKGDPNQQFGMMAQEVEKKKPKAVATGPDGLKRVNYKEALK